MPAQESLGCWSDADSDVDRIPDGERCLSFTVRGPWAHFRRIEGNIVKQTYRLPPRTTVAGLVAAILGIGRDRYYHLFAPDVSAVAVEPVRPLRTLNMPMNTLSTAKDAISTVPRRGKLRIGLPDPTKLRQQHNYEVLVDPAYRIDLWLADEQTHADLQKMLESGRSYYVPSLGLSEHLAEIEYHGEFEVEPGPDGEVEVDSAIPGAIDAVVPEEGVRYQIERSPSHMEATGSGRTTTAFQSYAYSPDAKSLRADVTRSSVVDDRIVTFG